MTARIIVGNALVELPRLPEESVHLCTTSPPYWGLRDYGLEPTVWGGDADCAHEFVDEEVAREVRKGMGLEELGKRYRGGGKKHGKIATFVIHRGTCARCGAWRGALGLEPTPDLFVQHMVLVFREVRRVLRSDGCCYVNMGDSYASGGGAGEQGRSGDRFERAHTQKYLGVNKGGRSNPENAGKNRRRVGSNRAQRGDGNAGVPFAPLEQPNRNPQVGLKAKDLVGVPWMLAFALRADGWYLRQDIVWQKPNPMPESTEDRCTKAHEYVFHLAKSERYFYDAEAIAEDAIYNAASSHPNRVKGYFADGKRTQEPNLQQSFRAIREKRNKRSVWTVATQPFPDAHFATFPPALIEPCILAGTSERGCCPTCLAGWQRVTAPTERYRRGLGRGFTDHSADDEAGMMQNRGVNQQNAMRDAGGPHSKETETIGWYPTCGCAGNLSLPKYPKAPKKTGVKATDDVALEGWRHACGNVDKVCKRMCDDVAGRPTVPAVVLDCFGGAGTTGLVADRARRDSILIEANPAYAEMARRRIDDEAGLFKATAAE